MKNKKFQLAALGTLLAAVIAVGAWLVLRTPGESAPDTKPLWSFSPLTFPVFISPPTAPCDRRKIVR